MLIQPKKITDLVNHNRNSVQVNKLRVNNIFDKNVNNYTNITFTTKENKLLANGSQFTLSITNKEDLVTIHHR